MGFDRAVFAGGGYRAVAEAVRNHLTTWLDNHPDQAAAALTHHVLPPTPGR